VTAAEALPQGCHKRFCRKCHRLHVAEEFEGSRKTCRKMIHRHNQNRRDRRAERHLADANGEAEARPQLDVHAYVGAGLHGASLFPTA
jgi:hypothetical protein